MGRKTEYLVDVAPEVRRIMVKHGLTQRAVAAQVGVSAMTVWFWLHGHRALMPYAAKVRTAARRLDRRQKRATTK